MKKLIVVLAMFALVGGAVFAQVSGYAELRLDAIRSGTVGGQDEIVTRGEVAETSIKFAGQNDEGTLGGLVVLKLTDPWNSWEEAIDLNTAQVWWQPVDQFRFYLGSHDDGMFESSGDSAWGFHRGTQNGVVNDPGYNYNGAGFAGNHRSNDGRFGWAMVIKPIDGLTLNLSSLVPVTLRTGNVGSIIKDTYQENIFAQIVYNLADVGDFYVTYDADGNQWVSGAPQQLGLAFHSNTLVDNFSLGLGFTYVLNWDDDGPFNFWDSSLVYQGTSPVVGPISAAFYAYYTDDDWGAKFRGRVSLGDGNTEALFFQADIMPWYNFGSFEVRFNVRLQYNANEEFGYSVNPYIIVPAAGGKFTAGFEYSDVLGTGTGSWRLPVGLSYSF